MNVDRTPRPERTPLVVDQRTIELTLTVLRPTPRPATCFFCGKPLPGPCCPSCDRP